MSDIYVSCMITEGTCPNPNPVNTKLGAVLAAIACPREAIFGTRLVGASQNHLVEAITFGHEVVVDDEKEVFYTL
uniref:Uncharacterized protein n=1 Tax=Acrobeloides nanus TaxID=290746 RepID=A0A914CAR0_9BILA